MTWTAWLQVFLSALGGGAITLVGTWLAGHPAERRRRESDRNKGKEDWAAILPT